MSLPRVYAYLDHRRFLRDWIEAKKIEDPAYSFARFAVEAGCSKGTLANVLSGQRMPRPDTLDAFTRAIGLEPQERYYLGLLVDRELARSQHEQLAIIDSLLETQRHGHVRHAPEVEQDDAMFRFLANWYTPAIQELATLPGFQADPAWISQRMVPPVTEEQASEAIATLVELGFLVVQPDGRHTPASVRFRTGQETANHAVARFQRTVVSEMLRNLDTSQSAEQVVVAHMLALDPSLFAEAKLRINTALEQIASLADGQSDRSERRVYQLTIQLFPLTTSPADSGEG